MRGLAEVTVEGQRPVDEILGDERAEGRPAEQDGATDDGPARVDDDPGEDLDAESEGADHPEDSAEDERGPPTARGDAGGEHEVEDDEDAEERDGRARDLEDTPQLANPSRLRPSGASRPDPPEGDYSAGSRTEARSDSHGPSGPGVVRAGPPSVTEL